MIIVAGDALLYNRFYPVTGTFGLTLKTLCFYWLPGYKTMRTLPKPNVYTVFTARVDRDFINLHRGIATLIPIDPSPKLTASQHPAVSSLEAYPTPAR